MSTPQVNSVSAICNMALTRIGSTQSITSLDDGSNEANQCKIWYPQSRDVLLADYPYPWAEAYLVLDQVGGPEINGQQANAQWTRSYRYPSDCIKVRRLVPTPIAISPVQPPQTTAPVTHFANYDQPWKRPEGQPCPITFGIGHDVAGRLIMTDFFGTNAGLTAVYTAAVEDPTQMAPDFVDALAWRLAAELAMALSFSDAKREWAHKEYEKHARTARATAMNEMQGSYNVRTQSQMINARWYR